MKLVTQLPTQDRYGTIDIAKDGRAFFTGSDKDWYSGDWIDVWDTASNRFVERFEGLLPKGASFSDQAEGLSSQKEVVIENDLNRLIAIVHGPVALTNPKELFPILVAVDLSTKRVVWQVVEANSEDALISLALSS